VGFEGVPHGSFDHQVIVLRIQRSSVDPSNLGVVFATNEKQKVLSIGKKYGPAMTLLSAGRVELCNLPRRTAVRWYLVDRRSLRREENNPILAPSPAPRYWHITKNLDEISFDVDPLQFRVGEESDRTAVRRPEGQAAVLRTRKRSPLSCVVDGAQPETFSVTVPDREHNVRSIRRDRRQPVVKGVELRTCRGKQARTHN
jgi:hypothetical protein